MNELDAGRDRYRELVDNPLRQENHKGREQSNKQLVWFSYLQKRYQVQDLGFKKILQWKKEEPEERWDWDNCTVTRAKILPSGKVRIVIRSKTNRNSDYMGKIPVQLRFMIGIDLRSVSVPYIDTFSLENSKRKNLPKFAKMRTPHKRWVFKLDDRYWIWQWAKDAVDIKSTYIYMLYEDILNFLNESSSVTAGKNETQMFSEPKEITASKILKDNCLSYDNNNSNDTSIEAIKRKDIVFDVKIEDFKDFIPVIYQPAVDSLKNFVRQIHCAKTLNADMSADMEVSIIFNNEALRRHGFLDSFYKGIRLFLYGRNLDIETFRIHLETDGNNIRSVSEVGNINRNDDKVDHDYFTFAGIYSGDCGIEEDTIHLDKEPPTPRRRVEYYFINHYHPIVFINTANHAMGQHDSNNDLWKWEYIPWAKKAPIRLGKKTREEIDNSYSPFIKKITKIFGQNRLY